MKNLLIIICFLPLFLNGQSKKYPDYQWPIGVPSDRTDSLMAGNALIKFETDAIEIESLDLNMDFEATVAIASDSLGNLLFYSNGCEIRNAAFEIMPGGEMLNPGALHDWICDKGYTLHKGAMALQYPNNPSKWILLHSKARYDAVRKLVIEGLYFSEIDLTKNNGLGEVSFANKALLEANLENFTVVRHGNGRDWWIVAPEYGTSTYHYFLFSPEGIAFSHQQSIGHVFDCNRIGSSTFSLDGSKYARRMNCWVSVLDFDRCQGTFSNPVDFPRPINTNGHGGVAFSKDNKWLYTNDHFALFSADLESNQPELDSLYKGIEWYYYQNSLDMMQYGPDGKIYLSALHSDAFFSTFEPHDAAQNQVVYHLADLELPMHQVRSLPHFPNFRLFDFANSPCDTLGINTVSIEKVEEKKPVVLKIYPQPASEVVYIETQDAERIASLSIYDSQGRKMINKNNLATGAAIPLRAFPSGVYFLQVLLENGRFVRDRLSVQH